LTSEITYLSTHSDDLSFLLKEQMKAILVSLHLYRAY